MSIALYSLDDFNNLPEYTIRLVIGKPIGGFSLHTGIIFKFEGKVQFLHLAWHHILSLEAPPDITYYDKIGFLDFPFFDKTDEFFLRRKAIIPFFLLVHELNKDSIPYAMLYQSSKFLESGHLDLGKDEFGLTCATFIIAIFKSSGISLVLTETWPNRDADEKFFEKIFGYLKDKISPEHAEHLSANRSCIRFRAEEIAASSTIYEEPIKFKDAEILGAELHNILTKEN